MNIDDSELDLNIALQQAIDNIGNKKNKFLHFFGRFFQYADEPKFFQYTAQYLDLLNNKKGNHGSASGFSFFSQKLAVLKCFLEALERFAVNHYNEKDIVFSTSSLLDKPFLDILKITSFSNTQRKLNPNMQIDIKESFGWVLGKKLSSMEDFYIPVQLIYLSYLRQEQEGFLRLPITTGAASGTAYSAAIYRGLCEVIERDAFMITYLNRLPRSRVPLEKSKNENIKKILASAKNYSLKLYSFDISTDIEIYSFVTFVYDSTGIASTISTGLKSDLNPTEALLGSIQEAFHPRTWLRHEKDKFTGTKTDLQKPFRLLDRGLLWSSLDVTKQLNFLLQSKNETKTIEEYEDKSEKTASENLHNTIKFLKNKGYDAYFVDITPKLSNITKTNFKVVMTVIPELQPLYLDERYPYLGGNRLYDVPVKLGYLKKPNNENSLNKFPHPFL